MNQPRETDGKFGTKPHGRPAGSLSEQLAELEARAIDTNKQIRKLETALVVESVRDIAPGATRISVAITAVGDDWDSVDRYEVFVEAFDGDEPIEAEQDFLNDAVFESMSQEHLKDIHDAEIYGDDDYASVALDLDDPQWVQNEIKAED